MFTQIISAQCFLLVLVSLQLGQQNNPSPAVQSAIEFPAQLQQGVVAGKTAIGTKVQAKLQMATMVNGTVVPRNATLFGEVTESTAKISGSPSRLAIRIDSAQWKNGSAAINAYLSEWYYPTIAEPGQNLQYEPPQSPTRTWNGQGAYPNPNSPSYKPFPGGDSDAKQNSVPQPAASKTSEHRALLKDIELVSSGNGAFVIVSKRTNIKLDRLTTYVFATSDLLATK